MTSRRFISVSTFFIAACLWILPVCDPASGSIDAGRVKGNNVEPVADIRDIKSPLPVGISFSGRLAGCVALVVAGAVVAGYLRTKRKSSTGSLPGRAGYAADAALAVLREKYLVPPGDTRLFCQELSHLVRSSLPAVSGIPALQLTTEEFLRGAAVCKVITAGDTDLLRDFLQYCDLVKFAGHVPSVMEVEQSFTLAEEIILLFHSRSRE